MTVGWYGRILGPWFRHWTYSLLRFLLPARRKQGGQIAFVAGLVPWWISHWRLGASFFGMPLFRFAGGMLITLGVIGQRVLSRLIDI
jgi:hypothetical protein